MKIYLVSVYYDSTTDKRIYTTEKQAKEVALKLAKNTTAYLVVVDELEPHEGQFMITRSCGRYDKTSE